MVMSDKTAIVQLKISRNMMLINIGGARGGHFRHANVEMKWKKKKGLFGEALFLTTSHLVVWVIISITDCNPQHRVTSIATAFGPPNFQLLGTRALNSEQIANSV